MYEFNSELSKKEYDNFISEYSMASFMQDYNWSNIKDNWGSLHCGLYKDKKLVGVCLILIKKIFKKINMFYIPRGYLMDFENYDDLNEMTKNIKILAKKYHAYTVKIDPNFCISDNSLKGEECEHNYSKNYDIKNSNLKKLGYKYTGLHKEISKNLQPQFNMFAPLCNIDSKIYTNDELLSTYKSKVKYYFTGSFHTNRGITYEITDDIKRTKDLVAMLKETEIKQKINLRNEEYFNKIMTNYKDYAYLVFGKCNLKTYYEYLINNNGKEDEINAVKDELKNNDEILLSASLIILPKNRKGIRTSEYLYAGNSNKFTNLNVSAGLVYNILKFSIENDCHYCNLGGVDGNLNDHLSKFKQKYNARVMIFCGEYDLPTSILYYPIKLFYPMLLKIYKFTKRK